MRPNVLRILAFLLTSSVGASAFAHSGHHEHGYHQRPAFGQVVITNEATTAVDVALSSGATLRLQPGERTLLRAPVGATEVRATYAVLGQRVVLETEQAFVQRDRVARVRIEPEDEAFVQITNRTGTTADVFVSSRFVATLAPGASHLAAVEPGRTRLLMIDPHGEILDRGRVDAALDAPTAWIAEPPVRNGTLTMRSTVAIPTTVYVDGRRIGEMAPNGALRAEIPSGHHEVAVVDARGRTLETRSMWIEPGRNERMEADGDRSVAFADVDETGGWTNERGRSEPDDDRGHIRGGTPRR